MLDVDTVIGLQILAGTRGDRTPEESPRAMRMRQLSGGRRNAAALA
ncbi:MAG: hypothetical protein J4G15_07955 [Alphaproteobacteria bacterium]|nr:hypothetical protein [Alphaproteobacteria bacterium]